MAKPFNARRTSAGPEGPVAFQANRQLSSTRLWTGEWHGRPATDQAQASLN